MSTRLRKALARRVERGATYLDKHRPGWWRKVRIKRLDMGHPHKCVLGQLDGDFLAMLDELHPRSGAIGWADRHGFEFPYSLEGALSVSDAAVWSVLDEEWRAQIADRRRKVRRS